MIRALPLVKAIASAAVLAAVAPSMAGVKTAPPAPTTAATPAATYTFTIGPNTLAVEHLPKSNLAWEFDHEPDGTAAIKGPGGTIWKGNLQVGMGPYSPQKPTSNVPSYRVTVPDGNGLQKYFQIVPPSVPPAPKLPNATPVPLKPLP